MIIVDRIAPDPEEVEAPRRELVLGGVGGGIVVDVALISDIGDNADLHFKHAGRSPAIVVIGGESEATKDQ